jgi:hypothetical protein
MMESKRTAHLFKIRHFPSQENQQTNQANIKLNHHEKNDFT